jgi:hypothetical protein
MSRTQRRERFSLRMKVGLFGCQIVGTPTRSYSKDEDKQASDPVREDKMEKPRTIEEIAISLQRTKTAMETMGIQTTHMIAYRRVSEAIYALEQSAHVDAPSLRDAEDQKACASKGRL